MDVARSTPRTILLILPLLPLWAGTPSRAAEPTSDARPAAWHLPPLGVGESITHRANAGRDDPRSRNFDLYAVEVDSGGTDARVVVNLTAADETNSVFDPYVRLFGANGRERSANDDGRRGSKDARLSATISKRDTDRLYFIGVSDAGNPRYDIVTGARDRNVEVASAYTLSVSVDSVLVQRGSNEPNDTVQEATFMGNGSFSAPESYGGLGDAEWLDDALDVDIYKISLLEPATVTARFVHVLRGDESDEDIDYNTIVRIRNCTDPHDDPRVADPCGLGVADGTSLDSGVALSAAFFEPADGVYIMVSGTPNRDYDPTRAQSGVPGYFGPYILDVEVTPFEAGGPFEPNDSLPTATDDLPMIVPGPKPPAEPVQIDAVLGDGPWHRVRGDRDFYKVNVGAASGMVRIDLAPTPADTRPVTYMAVYDASGKLIAQSDRRHASEPATLRVPAPSSSSRGNVESLYVMVGDARLSPVLDLFDPPDATPPALGPVDLVPAWPAEPYRLTLSLESPAMTPDQPVALPRCGFVELTPAEFSGPDALYAAPADGSTLGVFWAVDLTSGYARFIGDYLSAADGPRGIALGTGTCYVLGDGRFPYVRRCSGDGPYGPDRFPTWMGSGCYSDITELGGKLFLLDYGESAIHVMNSADGQYVCTIPVGEINGISLAGGLASLAAPARLFAADAFDSRQVYEIDMAGRVRHVLRPLTKRPIALAGVGSIEPLSGGLDALLAIGDWESPGANLYDRGGVLLDTLDLPYPVSALGGNGNALLLGDGDLDGDLDLVDAMRLQRCFGLSGGLDETCAATDLTGDGQVNLADVALFAMSVTGP